MIIFTSGLESNKYFQITVGLDKQKFRKSGLKFLVLYHFILLAINLSLIDLGRKAFADNTERVQSCYHRLKHFIDDDG